MDRAYSKGANVRILQWETGRGDECRYGAPIVLDSGARRRLWFALDPDQASLVSPSSDAALLALLVPAMFAGEGIHVEGCISDDLLFKANGPIQVLLLALIPGLRRIQITANNRQVLDRGSAERGVATGFSAGVDSFCVLADRFYAEGVPKNLRVSHLTFNNVGSHGSGERGRVLFRERLARIRPVAASIGLPLVAVDSNLDEFYPSGIGFELTHSIRNAAAGLLLQAGIQRLLYASSFHFDLVAAKSTYNMAYADPISLPLISTESFAIESVGSEYERTEKTMRVATIGDSWRALNVCVNANAMGENCSTCWKCLRTQLTLEIGGVLDLYAEVFDLDKYRRHRSRYVASIAHSDEPFQRDIFRMGTRRGFYIPRPGPMRRGVYRGMMVSRPILKKTAAVIAAFGSTSARRFDGGNGE